MNKPKIFIDGMHGTTGLLIRDILRNHGGLDLIEIEEARRKDPSARLSCARQSDLTVLCLSDENAVEAAENYSKNAECTLIDAGSAHRVNPDWLYGAPELLPEVRSKIKSSHLISNPGCYALGALSFLKPLNEKKLLPDFLSVTGLSGYSGGGRKMIEFYEKDKSSGRDNFRGASVYSLGKTHKHIPEMTVRSGYKGLLAFTPAVVEINRGMIVMASFECDDEHVKKVCETLKEFYKNEPFIYPHEMNSTENLRDGFLDLSLNVGHNKVDIFVYRERNVIQLLSVLDNLGKGSAMNAVQLINMKFNFNELTGLA